MNPFEDRQPIYGQDPYVTKLNHTFLLLCESIDEERIAISTLDSLEDPRRIDISIVWDDAFERQVWAPELHHIDDLWYIYYSASNGDNKNHRTYVLQSPDVFGPYFKLGLVGPDIWGIDMTQFEWNGNRYAVWSGWENNGDEFPQNLYIAQMYSPWEIGERVCLSVPELDWEKSVAPILEGPQIWMRNGTVSIVYSGNASWKQEYSTGSLTLMGRRNPLNPEDWVKRTKPLMSNAGHGCIVDDYFIYHRKMSAFPGWHDREIRSVKIWEE